ncbi:hypothetical protein PENFLA_c072G10515 [Penicillium flavigenum]|uniref:Uncharacterized protein n=1 Tax=Penicillium flavigenum TaxID=254877 RepID=A0A1V6SCJ5_9EURO|nr:hypothetical protein PENFLA_c072G10515 [Penicillium flavigenum]
MSHNPTTSPVLDCSDTPLSITGNVIGILTFAYAIFITLLYRSKTLIKAKDESKRFYIRAERVHSSLIEAQKRLEAYFSTLGLSMNPEIGLLLEDARYWAFKYKQGLRSKPGYKPTTEEIEAEKRREAMAKGFYLFMKEDMDKVVEGMLQTRATLDGTYQVLLNSMIVDEIREQKTVFEVQSQSLSKQRAMIINIMGALNLEVPADSTSMDSTKPELSQKKISINMSEIYLQPSGKEDNKRPSQNSFFRSKRPPLCGCGQSHTADESGNPKMGEIFIWRTLARVHEEAEKLEIQVVETLKMKLGQDHPDTLASMANLALGM